jgi:hypothetical protein
MKPAPFCDHCGGGNSSSYRLVKVGAPQPQASPEEEIDLCPDCRKIASGAIQAMKKKTIAVIDSPPPEPVITPAVPADAGVVGAELVAQAAAKVQAESAAPLPEPATVTQPPKAVAPMPPPGRK